MRTRDGVAVNFYGPCSVELPLARGVGLTLSLETNYPSDGRVALKLTVTRPHRFTLRLRIPAWSRHTRVSINGRAAEAPRVGAYLTLRRQWRSGDAVKLSFDMALHVWPGEREAAGRASVYRGPLLLAYDQRFNDFDPDELPPLDSQDLTYVVERPKGDLAPWLLLKLKAADGRTLRLCDFASAGAAGTHYRSWLPMRGVEALPSEAISPFAVRLG